MRGDNRFVPGWLPLSELRQAPFLIWQPVKRQLLRDLANGYRDSVIEIVADPLA
jgi:hypothetical protein